MREETSKLGWEWEEKQLIWRMRGETSNLGGEWEEKLDKYTFKI